jgi:mono/diheme cytochrome c family protein
MKNTILGLFAAVALFAGCKEQPAAVAVPVAAVTAPVVAAPPVAAAPADNAAVAKELVATRCTPCHGPSGGGDGPASAGLTPKPANFAAAEWQKAVTDEHIEKIILYGGMAVGKSAAMPPNPDLGSKPEVVTALRQHLRGMKK